MYSRWRIDALLLGLLLTGCHRDVRGLEGEAPKPERRATLESDAARIAAGRRLYAGMNCSGCHGYGGGGGMGPSLSDDDWRYGGSTAEIVATILHGRPNGMPTFRERLSEEQARQLAEYVRSLSATSPLPDAQIEP